ncbi:chemotaxis protein [Photobacterium lipolyticum]|uniref:Chemotaxis protein n=1 Tax=Photobacterium lipolyticum TaxID=266810 RepID=A0A2T3N207_9GAMM|nr:chemotaxis protein [Photobacterium lipolyticum]PSW06265.1 chemotaxis protein [Photobacterium lipolyticum]
MGKGGKSQSTNNTTSTNVSGQNAIQGDNLGVAISGVNNSTINATMTDHGAIEKAAELGELALSSNVDVSKAALGMGEKALTINADVSNNAMELVTGAHGENLQMMAGLAGNQAAQNAENAENIGAIKELAAMKIDGGQVATSKQMTIVVSVVVFMLALVFIMRGGKS